MKKLSPITDGDRICFSYMDTRISRLIPNHPAAALELAKFELMRAINVMQDSRDIEALKFALDALYRIAQALGHLGQKDEAKAAWTLHTQLDSILDGEVINAKECGQALKRFYLGAA